MYNLYGAKYLDNLNDNQSISVSSTEIAITSTIDKIYIRYYVSSSIDHVISLAFRLSRSMYLSLLYVIVLARCPFPSW